MTDESYLKLILDGQKATGVKVDRLSDTVAILGERMRSWERTTDTAQDAHEKCRSEVDLKIHDHEVEDFAEHKELEKRIAPIENLHQQQAGGAKSATLIWKALSAVLGTIVIVLGIIGSLGGLG